MKEQCCQEQAAGQVGSSPLYPNEGRTKLITLWARAKNAVIAGCCFARKSFRRILAGTFHLNDRFHAHTTRLRN